MNFFQFILIFFFLSFFADRACASHFFHEKNIKEDTVKYRGYRVELYGFEVVKKTDDWVKVRFSTVNTGRMDVKMDLPTVHWVQFNFDRSLFDEKLGGYRDHIKYQMAKNRFKIAIGEVKENLELKFPVILPSGAFPKKVEPVVQKETKPEEVVQRKAPTRSVPIFAPEKTGDEAIVVHPDLAAKDESKAKEVNLPTEISPEKIKEEKEKKCPDLRFGSLRIVKEDQKWATLEYTIINDGEAPYHLFETQKGRDDGLIVRAYISGVKTLSRGALPIGGQIIQPGQRLKNKLEKGEEYQARIKLDIRKKTRYMKSLILKLDGAQYALECDRKNNTAAVILQ